MAERIWTEQKLKTLAELRREGFQGRLVVVEREGNLYDKLKEIDPSISAEKYYSARKTVKNKIKEYDEAEKTEDFFPF